MSRLQKVWSQVFNATGLVQTHLFLDAGSSSTRVMLGKKVVWHQPTCLTYHPQTTSVVHIGQSAVSTVGKTPSSITTSFPIRNGILTDMVTGKAFFSALLRQVLAEQQKKMIVNSRVTLSVPAAATPVQKKLWERVLHQAGFTQVTMVSKAEALFKQLQQTQPELKQLCLLDMGSQTTELAVFFDGQLVATQTILFGGDQYTEALKNVLRTEQQAVISWETAEKLKLQLKQLNFAGTLSDKEAIHKTAVRAKDVVSQVPTTVYVNRSVIKQQFKTITDELLLDIHAFLAQAPPEVMPVLMEQGLYVTGGGTLLSGLVPYLEASLKCAANPSSEPLLDVVHGVSIL